jgi:tetratricopeptide (TPR) repeat protein
MALKKEKVEVLETEQIQESIITEDKNTLLDFWNKYSKQITAGLIGAVVGAALFFGYKHFIKAPKELEAAEASYQAETLFGKMASTYFSKDSVNIVLNGGLLDGKKITGLLSIISKYGGTNAGNRATYNVGATYLHTKEFEKAIKFLKDFDNKGAYQTEIKKQTMLGHAYAELKKNDEALAAYTKATTVNKEDENFTGEALMVAGAFAEKIGKNKEAIDFYKAARDEYPNYAAVQNGDVDKYLAKLGVTN